MNNFLCCLTVFSIFLFSGCASIVKSEKMPVTFSGGLSNGETQINTPDGKFSTMNGHTTILVSRSKQDIPISVTCNSETRDGIIHTSFDTVAGVFGNVIFGGLIGLGIDSFGNKAYDPPSNYNLSPLCADQPQTGQASTDKVISADRVPAKEK